MKPAFLISLLASLVLLFSLNPASTDAQNNSLQGNNQHYSVLDVNNVSAMFSATGNHFWDKNGSHYEVPKGSGKQAFFLNSLWIGGKDQSGQLHFAGERYGQGPIPLQTGSCKDFFAGPVMDTIHYTVYQDSLWNRIWNLKKTEIDYHRAHFWETGYLPIEPILSWPGNGDTLLGQAWQLAPFSDRNGDGVYDPFDGDYPEIRGDQALFFIFNDLKGFHAESEGEKLGIEVHGMAYAFDIKEDSAMKNTIFLYYTLFNRSQNIYDSTFIGLFSDIDIGFWMDDRIECDVERNTGFAYNRWPVDGNGEPEAYGLNPPVQGITLLAGPYMDPDGMDNPRVDAYGNPLCDVSINGWHFGDSIVDNERLGMQHFFYINNSLSGVPFYMTDPDFAYQYYDLLLGKWKDGTTMIYGGYGHASSGGYGPECRFMFPGVSDSLHWGTGCIHPNGPVNWTDSIAGGHPQDRRGLMVTGPFAFHPGDVQELEIAFIWARDYTGTSPSGALEKFRDMVDLVTEAFQANTLSNGEVIYGVEDPVIGDGPAIKLYPNPTSGMVTLEVPNTRMPAGTRIEILNNQGTSLDQLVVDHPASSVTLNLTGYPSGFYFIAVTTPQTRLVAKVLVMD